MGSAVYQRAVIEAIKNGVVFCFDKDVGMLPNCPAEQEFTPAFFVDTPLDIDIAVSFSVIWIEIDADANGWLVGVQSLAKLIDFG
jgi:hypothetical protein